MTTAEAKFHVGQLVHHRLFDYRGVIVDVDAVFQGGDLWYTRVARSRPPRDKPWYRVLVDGAQHETYVAERNLEPDLSRAPVHHPLIDEYFAGLSEDGYLPLTRRN